MSLDKSRDYMDEISIYFAELRYNSCFVEQFFI